MADHESTQTHTLDLALESSLESVDRAEAAILHEAEALGFDEDDLHKIGISVRECMVNAVVHGNRYNARKKVQVKYRALPIGSGFRSPMKARDSTLRLCRIRSRMKIYCDFPGAASC